jgi:hypothetical protein
VGGGAGFDAISSGMVTLCSVNLSHNDVLMTVGSNDNTKTAYCQETIKCVATEVIGDGVVDELSPLKYINITIHRTDRNNSALEDGGTEIAVIKASRLPGNSYEGAGTVKVRGFVGLPLISDVVKLPIRLTDTDDCSLSILCTVCKDANEDLILPSNAVERLIVMLRRQPKTLMMTSLLAITPVAGRPSHLGLTLKTHNQRDDSS